MTQPPPKRVAASPATAVSDLELTKSVVHGTWESQLRPLFTDPKSFFSALPMDVLTLLDPLCGMAYSLGSEPKGRARILEFDAHCWDILDPSNPPRQSIHGLRAFVRRNLLANHVLFVRGVYKRLCSIIIDEKLDAESSKFALELVNACARYSKEATRMLMTSEMLTYITSFRDMEAGLVYTLLGNILVDHPDAYGLICATRSLEFIRRGLFSSHGRQDRFDMIWFCILMVAHPAITLQDTQTILGYALELSPLPDIWDATNVFYGLLLKLIEIPNPSIQDQIFTQEMVRSAITCGCWTDDYSCRHGALMLLAKFSVRDDQSRKLLWNNRILSALEHQMADLRFFPSEWTTEMIGNIIDTTCQILVDLMCADPLRILYCEDHNIHTRLHNMCSWDCCAHIDGPAFVLCTMIIHSLPNQCTAFASPQLLQRACHRLLCTKSDRMRYRMVEAINLLGEASQWTKQMVLKELAPFKTRLIESSCWAVRGLGEALP